MSVWLQLWFCLSLLAVPGILEIVDVGGKFANKGVSLCLFY